MERVQRLMQRPVRDFLGQETCPGLITWQCWIESLKPEMGNKQKTTHKRKQRKKLDLHSAFTEGLILYVQSIIQIVCGQFI